MDKIWHLNIEGKEEGPYSIRDLRRHPAVTPDTLAWREGLDSWKPIRQLPELDELFYEKPPEDEEREKDHPAASIPPEDEVALSFYKDPYFLILWFVIVFLILMYALYVVNRWQ
ncbi:MAG: DUF4339 domain-containing protein [Waddliaceae bacterium]